MKTNELKQISEEYLNRLKLRGKSKNTIKQYRAGIKTFITFLEDNKIDTFNLEAIDSYRRYLKEQARTGKIKYATLNAKGTALSGLIKYINDPVLLETQDIKIKVQQNFKECLNEEEYNRLLMFAKVENPKYYLLWKFIGSTGLRISEALSVTASQIKKADRARGKKTIEVLGKGEKLRSVSIPDEIRSELMEYIEKNNIKNYIFHTTKIKEVNGKRRKVINDEKPVDRTVAYKSLNRLAKKIGLDPALCSPHLLRHYYSLDRLSKLGNDMEAVRKLSKELGHSSIDTTMIYLEMREDEANKEPKNA